MSVCGQDFIDFAEKCVNFGDEIGFRNAIGRSYYGVYHEICEKLEKCPDLKSHQAVRDYLINDSWLKGNEPFDKMKLVQTGTYLKHMHIRRKWADYELDRDMNKADAESIIIMAKKAMASIKDMHEAVYPIKSTA